MPETAKPPRGDAADPPDALVRAVCDSWPASIWRDLHVLVAVSGGADSVALLLALAAIKRRAGGQGRLFAAHFNHAARGDASDADERWVRRLCTELGLPCETGRAAIEPSAGERVSEEAGRTARYAFLRGTAQRLGARHVATAHTRDDQVETILFRLFRGTGLSGFTGIPATRELSPTVTLVRPMLSVRRREVEAFLADRGQQHRTDSTNADARYTRNWLRRQVLPMLRERFGEAAEDAVLGFAGQVADAQQFIAEQSVQPLLRKVKPVFQGTRGGDSADGGAEQVRLDPRRLASAAPVVVRELCKHVWRSAGWPEQAMGADDWRRLAEYAAGEASEPAMMLPGGVRATRQSGAVVLSRGC
ncbi:MAG: tRNA lysidine(34) synthetase TilS [Planctomycetota bacterium]